MNIGKNTTSCCYQLENFATEKNKCSHCHHYSSSRWLYSRSSLIQHIRLVELELHRNDVKSQCKDLIFVRMDSTGMNLATLCRYLVLGPQRRRFIFHIIHRMSLQIDTNAFDRLERLHRELESNK